MNFIYVTHLMCWNYLIALITHNRNRNNRNNSGDGDNKKGAGAPPVVALNAVVLFPLCVIMSIRAIMEFQHIRWMT